MKECVVFESFSIKLAEICLNPRVSSSSRITILHADVDRESAINNPSWKRISLLLFAAFCIEERTFPRSN
jgi:hypothetical protein